MEEPTGIEESRFHVFSYSNVLSLEGSSSEYDSSQADVQDNLGDEDGDSADQTNESGIAFNSAVFVEQQAKKRRKQSNPVRYHTTQVLDTEEREELVSKIPEEALNLEITHRNSSEQPKKRTESLLTCHHCNSLFQSIESLSVHIEKEHFHKLQEKQLQQSHNNSTSLNGREANTSEPQQNSNSGRTSEVSSLVEQNLSAMPILCASSSSSLENREFAKTALFSPMPPLIPISHPGDGNPTNMSLSPTMFPNSVAPLLFPVLQQLQGQNPANTNSSNSSVRIFNPEAFCELCNKEFCNKYFLKTHKANKHGIYSAESVITSYSGTFLNSSLTNPMPLFPPLLQNLSIKPTSTQGIMNLEAFCEICQKEFCNKYFLKKHMYKIHGISIESQQNSGSSDNKATSPVASATDSPGFVFSIENNNNSLPDLAKEITKDNPHTLFTVQNNILLNQEVSPKQSSAAETVKSSTGIETKASIALTEDSSNSEKDVSFFAQEKLKETGVINTHKPNKLSVSIPESTGKVSQSDREGTSSTSSETGQVCTSNNTSETLLQGYQTEKEGTLSYGEETRKLICETCNRSFASQYLLKMHKFYTHNIPYIEEEEKSKPSSPVSPKQPSSICNISNHTIPVVSNQQTINMCSTYMKDDASGQDLLKLQSMIKELNSSVVADDNRVTCGICSIHFDNKYYLRAHMINEHGFLLSEDGSSTTSSQKIKDNTIHTQQPYHSLTPPPKKFYNLEVFCEICQNKFSNKYFLQVHKQNVHNIWTNDTKVSSPSTHSEKPYVKSVQSLSSSSVIPFTTTVKNKLKTLTGSNFCNICNKELCNKYFMKTHMLKMHGIDLNEQPKEAAKISTIGGVTCEVCQKKLCSKYFLKVHKQNTHGIYDEPFPSKELTSQSSSAVASDQKLLPGELIDSRYFTHYTEICPLCDRHFKSIKWLKTHIINDHNSAKENVLSNPQSTVVNDILAVCVMCGQRFSDQVALQVHLIKDHHSLNEETGIPSNIEVKTSNSSGDVNQGQLHKPVNGGLSPRAKSTSLGLLQRKGGLKLYHCSYCTYNTCWLSNLYAHEKRHTKIVIERDKKFLCKFCHRIYRYNHSLQRHLLSHRAAGFAAKDLPQSLKTVSHLFTKNNGEKRWNKNIQNTKSQMQVKQQVKTKKRYRCSKCDKKFCTRELCLTHIHATHKNRKSVLCQKKMQKSFHCPACRFTVRVWSMLKLHISKQHDNNPEILRRAEIQHSFLSDDMVLNSKKSCSEEFKKPVCKGFSYQLGLPPVDHGGPGKLPLSYALPQSPHTAGTFMMQPFFLAQPEIDGNNKNYNFVPSLVYLPVCQKISQPLTVAFSLTPA
ncbi:uncharacterized protein LOC143249362 [Tachypleus tridentatus]|uniref:uncharacterized protein LOC143249362 n=1 Tax=Tachypleus tridentatus TaxID=6853 RepID=UPI003FD10D6F